MVVVKDSNTSGWSLVAYDDVVGWAPSDYLEKLDDLPDPSEWEEKEERSEC